jgi:hypothetical protein
MNLEVNSTFERFLCHFSPTSRSEQQPNQSADFLRLLSATKETGEFLTKFGGCSFKQGIYRIHLSQDINKWTEIVQQNFPHIDNNFICFASDWLGRQFALALGMDGDDKQSVLRFDIGSNLVVKIPTNFEDFHNNELVDYPDDTLEASLFTDWINTKSIQVKPSQCIGYKHPPFLGGQEEIDNLQIRDIEVYWEILGQILRQSRKENPEITISKIETE